MISAKLAIGPMSTESIEAVFRYSHFRRKQLMLIASKNQVDYAGGYVNNWTTKEYMDFVKKMKEKYSYSDVVICRDHCGPGFNGNYDLEDTYKTIKDDILNGFDLIHIDFCHFKGTKEEKFEASKKAIEYCLSLNPGIKLEVGTDENLGTKYSVTNIKEEIAKEIDFFKQFCNPEFYVVQTGSLVKEINQVGTFNKNFIGEISEILRSRGLKLKEHNADYLPKEDISLRSGVVDAMNIAPQLGSIQTGIILNRCLIYGIDFGDFVNETYLKGKWKKWMLNNDENNKFLCVMISGHYNFSSDSYKKLISQLEKREDIHELIINSFMELIDHYVS